METALGGHSEGRFHAHWERLGTLGRLIILTGWLLYPAIANQEQRRLLRRLTVVVDQNVGVHLQEEADVGVPNAITHHSRADAGLQGASRNTNLEGRET